VRFDDGQFLGCTSHSPQRAQRIVHVVEHAQEQHYVECAQARQVHRHEILDDSFHLAAEGLMRHIEWPLAGQAVWLPMRSLHGRERLRIACRAFRAVLVKPRHVDRPDIVI
jgi:hypothetical protein